MAGRSFWASLHSVARAQFKQAAAERREKLVVIKREAADARSEAVGAVMRYVCHELRNPLHGIIVRQPPHPSFPRAISCASGPVLTRVWRCGVSFVRGCSMASRASYTPRMRGWGTTLPPCCRQLRA